MSTVSQTPDMPQPAELHEALLDADTLSRLFEDIALLAELHEVTVKGARFQHSSQNAPQINNDGPMQLEEARSLLTSGAVRAVQVRYRFDSAEWWDTLLNVPGGVRLVRIRHVWSDVTPSP